MSNLAKAEKSIDVRENDKDVREDDRLLAEVRRRPMHLSVYAPALTSHSGNLITPHLPRRTSAEERVAGERLGEIVGKQTRHRGVQRGRSERTANRELLERPGNLLASLDTTSTL